MPRVDMKVLNFELGTGLLVGAWDYSNRFRSLVPQAQSRMAVAGGVMGLGLHVWLGRLVPIVRDATP